jgi:hypothetical protein
MAQRGGTLVHRGSAQETLYIYEGFYESMKEHGHASVPSFGEYSGMYSGDGLPGGGRFSPFSAFWGGSEEGEVQIYICRYVQTTVLSKLVLICYE